MKIQTVFDCRPGEYGAPVYYRLNCETSSGKNSSTSLQKPGITAPALPFPLQSSRSTSQRSVENFYGKIFEFSFTTRLA